MRKLAFAVPAIRTRQISFMDGSGDTAIKWNPDDPQSVAQAKAEWDRITKPSNQGGLARTMFRENEYGGGRVTEFNPEESVVAVKKIHAG